MTIDKARLKPLVDSPRCGASWPQFESVCGKTKNGATTWQCGECARKEAAALRAELDKAVGLFRDADEHANHWQQQSQVKGRCLRDLEAENKQLLAEIEKLRTLAQNALVAELYLPTERDLLRVEAEKLRRDAKRYRWLRDPDHQGDPESGNPKIICGYEEHEDIMWLDGLDAAIDAGMTQEAGDGDQ